MGWFWQAPNAADKAAGPVATPTQLSPPPKPTLSRDAEADREMAKFWEMIQDEVNPGAKKPAAKPAPPPTNQPSQPASSSWLPWSSAPERPAPESPLANTPPARSEASRALSEASLPSTMSCRDAFDYAWHCHTAGAQWNAVYRYGGVRSCTELWDDFWFCMRTRSYPPDNRAEAVREHFRAKEAAKYDGKPSSEDVWESRETMVEPGSVFNQKFDMPTTADAQMQREELRRRQEVRRGLGYDQKD